MTLLDAARRLHAAGLAVVPVLTDGTKAPAVTWKGAQSERPGLAQLERWFTGPAHDGLGIVCGAVSGNLEMFEIEGRAAHLVAELATLMEDNGFGELWRRLCTGYLEQSPSGGMHWLYRVEGPAAPNTKLAKRPATAEELEAHKAAEREKAAAMPDLDLRRTRLERIEALTAERFPQVLIETRGEGGFTVCAPSAGRTHATGQPWILLAGGPETIPTISVDERDALFALSAVLDQMPAVDEPQRPLTVAGDRGERPGDDFNARASWDDILLPHGWTRLKKLGPGWGWVRPGKGRGDGISATTGQNEADNLYVFSTSTEFDDQRPYSKFAAYAVLEHGGDYAAAARALREAGYGKEASRPAPSVDLIAHARDSAPHAGPGAAHGAQPATDGSLAVVTQLRPAPASTLAHSDDANALALVEAYGDVLRFCSDRGRWYAWNGHLWEECPRGAGAAREYAKVIARALPEYDKASVNHKKRSLSAVGITAMLKSAESDARVAVLYRDLDAHAWELNTPLGIVDLRTGRLGPSDASRLHSRSTSCAPDFAADRSEWLRFLDKTFGGDQELIEYLQRLVGYSAVGTVGPHRLPYCHGSGGNGKGVFLETCVSVLGGYATTAPAGFLMAKVHQGHETEVARLAGARMVLCSEVNEDDRFDEARVKLLTGGDRLTARFMQQDHFTFTPTHQLWAMGNHQPHVRAGGRAFWRRLRLIPFLHEVPAAEMIDDLQGILASEHGPAVLAWIVEGAAAYARDGLEREPASVKAATDGYERDQDTVARFLEEMCVLGGGEHVQTKIGLVREAYELWCSENGDRPVTAKAFGLALQKAGVGSGRNRTARFYTGLHLISSDENASQNASHDADGWFR